MGEIEENIRKELISEAYEFYMSITLIEEFFSKKRNYRFDSINANIEKFAQKNRDNTDIVIGIEQFPMDWSMERKISFMAYLTELLPQTIFAVPSNQYKEYERAILEQIEIKEAIYNEIFEEGKDDYLIKIADRRVGGNVSYIKLFDDGLIRMVCEDPYGKLQKKEIKASPGLLHNARMYARNYIEDAVANPVYLAVDDRCHMKCFKMNCGHNVFGYNEKDYPESGLYFYNRTKSAIINNLLNYYLEFAENINAAYLLVRNNKKEII